MNLLHKRAGGVHNLDSVCFQNIVYMLSHTMGTDDDDSLVEFFQLLLGFDDPYALFLQILYHLFVVDDRPVGINRFPRVPDLFINLIHGAFNAETEARGLSNNHFHNVLSP